MVQSQVRIVDSISIKELGYDRLSVILFRSRFWLQTTERFTRVYCCGAPPMVRSPECTNASHSVPIQSVATARIATHVVPILQTRFGTFQRVDSKNILIITETESIVPVQA